MVGYHNNHSVTLVRINWNWVLSKALEQEARVRRMGMTIGCHVGVFCMTGWCGGAHEDKD